MCVQCKRFDTSSIINHPNTSKGGCLEERVTKVYNTVDILYTCHGDHVVRSTWHAWGVCSVILNSATVIISTHPIFLFQGGSSTNFLTFPFESHI